MCTYSAIATGCELQEMLIAKYVYLLCNIIKYTKSLRREMRMFREFQETYEL